MLFLNEQEYKNLCGIYQIRNLSNGMIYVGQTRGRFQKRFWLHQWKLRNNTHDNIFLQDDWNKYGEENFVFEVVEAIADEGQINQREMVYIDDCRQAGCCYNIADGGDGKRGVPMSERAKRMVGEKNRTHNLGKHASESTKAKMSASRKGKKRDPAVMEALRQTRIGCHHSDDARQKMSEARIRAYKEGRIKSALDEEKAASIKRMLMAGKTKSEISKLLGVAYHNVKAVENCKVWCHVFVQGWDEFISSK